MEKQMATFVFRSALVLLVFAAITVLVRTRLVQGIVLPVRVTGGSMALALPGRHFEGDCGDCGYGFRFGVESPPRDGFAVCPNCGFQANDVGPRPPTPGQRVLIDRISWRANGPRRWQAVAIRRSGGEPHLAVKRVVGLPGERIAVRGGEIYANDRMVRKSLDEFRHVALLVHDNQYRPQLKTGLPRRWSPQQDGSGWRESAAGDLEFRLPGESDSSSSPTGGAGGLLDWMAYHHWPGLPPPARRVQESRVLDNYGYNQALSRSLNEVDDLMLQVRLTMRGPGRVAFRGGAASKAWEVRLDLGGRRTASGAYSVPAGDSRITVGCQGRQVREAVPSAVDWQTPRWLELATVDGRLLVAVDGQTVLSYVLPTSRPDGRKTPSEVPPLAIGVAEAEVSVSYLRIYRDLYYLHPYGTATAWSMDDRLGADEIFVVGDNCPVSRDSRNWPHEGVKLRDVLGYVWWRR